MKLNRHLIIDAEILEKTFNEIMVCKRQTIIAHIRTNQESSTRSLLSTIGMRALRKGRNAALKLFAILNLSEPVSHAT